MAEVRVLIADDHEMVRKGIRAWIEEEPDLHVVAEATRGADVLRLVQSLQPDVLMLDLHFPDMHGLDIIGELRSVGNTIPILVMTGYERRRTKAVIDAGANGFLNKEEAREHVIDAIRWAARREAGTWISPSAVAELMSDRAAIAAAELTKTEVKVLALIEHSNLQIADMMGLSEGTVRNHISNIYSKLNVTTRLEAAAWARAHGVM